MDYYDEIDAQDRASADDFREILTGLPARPGTIR